jgi:DNA-binding CsgD family transcriptional regulator
VNDGQGVEPRRGEVHGARVAVAGRDLFVLSMPSLVASLPAELTSAEREVAALLLDGKSNREVAALRGTSVRTIANQVGAIFRKLRVSGRVELGHTLLSGRPRKRR